MRRAVLLVALAALLAACGGTMHAGSGADSTTLQVTIWPAGKTGPSTTKTVTCPGPEVCGELDKLPLTAFDPVPADMGCTMQFGGPDVAHVTGTVRGQSVDATFNRSGGCEIDRWNKVSFLLGPAS